MEKIFIYAAGAIIGGLAGFLYWKFVGCSSGTCPITSSPYASTIYGLVFGLLIASGFTSRSAAASPVKKPETIIENQKERKMTSLHLTKSDFLEKVADYENNPTEWKYLGDKPAIIDFYADWCAPCRRLSPELEALAQEYGGKIYVYIINVDKEQELSAVFGIRSIPTLLFIPMEGSPTITQGALPRHELKKLIEEKLLHE